MEPQELLEVAEKADRRQERLIGVTMAIFAALLATVTMYGHRMHTEEVVLQTRLADGWAFYQAKNIRSQMYAADATLADLSGERGAKTAEAWQEKSKKEREEADEIRKENESLDKETQATASRANKFDAAEVCLEMAIVLCSIALLARAQAFWYASFLGAIAGAALAVLGLLH